MSTNTAAPANVIDQLRANPRLPLVIGVSVAVAAIAALWLWSRAPDYGVLYSNLSDRDGGAIIASLQQMNIPYKFAAGGGALMVAANKVPEARLRLASQGLPKGGSVGFELMDNQKFGTSQFAEQVNYQRALEGELARSINAISAVESARVHLALPKPSLFVRDQKKPSASVVLNLHRSRSLDEGQVSAIVHLISSSVPDLSPKSITVVDQAGNLLSAANADNRGLDVSQLKYSQEIEQGYIRRIEAILQPIVGTNNVHAQVVADIDFSIVENTDEKYSPNQGPDSAAIRSQQSSESDQQSGGGAGSGSGSAGGVPGALTNQPAADPVAPITSSGQAPNRLPIASQTGNLTSTPARSSGPGSNRKDSTTNYELDRSIRHMQVGAGGIKRLSVAVVVNYRSTVDTQGKRSAQALSAAELSQVQNLVRESMGFNAARGDSLNVVNSAFATELLEVDPPLPWWRQPANIALARELGQYLLLAILALFAWFALVRPLLKNYLAPAAPVTGGQNGNGNGNSNSNSANNAPSSTTQAGQQTQNHLNNVKFAQETAAKEPRMVAMLIKHWMEKNAG